MSYNQVIAAYSYNWTTQFTADLVSFTGEILNSKLQFLCSDINNFPVAKQ